MSFVNHENRCSNVLIVGGGPAGLATALMLAKRGWTGITVLEKCPTADYYESDKSYSYQIDGRGQKFTDFLGITEQLAKISLPNTEFYLTSIKANGDRKTIKLPTVDRNRKTAYWLPRRALIRLLYQEIEQHWQEQITILFNTSCTEIHKEGETVKVIARSDQDDPLILYPRLLVGCDGLHSLVRNTLNDWDISDRFAMEQFPSPSAGLRYKVLRIPSDFPLDSRSEERSTCTMAYIIRSALQNPKQAVSLGLLPLKSSEQYRTANIITRPNHEIWNLKTQKEMLDFLEQSFPQIPISKIVSPEEVEQLAKSEGGSFPNPQYCSGFHFLLKSSADSKNLDAPVAIVLLGDAIHCFPPDIGQGVNSALEDVCVLQEALSQSNDNLSQALPLYESWRFPDTKALVRISQFAFPWQYNQDKFRKLLWSVNFFLRLLLSRILPWVFYPPVFFLIQNHELSYQEILAIGQRTTQRLYLLAVIIVGIVLSYSAFHFSVGKIGTIF